MSVFENVMISIPGQVGERLGACLFPFSKISVQERNVREKALQILDYLGLADKADILVENLSYPEQKLLSLARLLATGADFFLMDEPTSGVDLKSIDKILDTVREVAAQGRTVCIVEHNMDVVRDISDHMIFMAQGRSVKCGDPETIFSDSELARIYLGKKRGS
jgi:branched-chain amino acid transport system permease protein